MNNKEDKVLTRATLKLIQGTEFKPRHRSTEVIGEASCAADPFTRSPRIRRSPERPSTPGTEKEDIPTGKPRSEQEEVAKRTPGPKRTIVTEEVDIVTENNSAGRKQELTMNTTIAESLANPKTPAVPKFLSPPVFDPCAGNAISFIKTYDRTAAANSWDNNLKISYLGSFLEGAADLWFKKYILKPENLQNTWEDIKGDFLREFEGADVKRMMEKKLWDTKQRPRQSILSYFYELQTVFGEYDPLFNIEEFRKFFENGMDKLLYKSYRLILDDELDWDKFKKIVRKLEDITILDEVNVSLKELRLGEEGDNRHCHECHQMREQFRQPDEQPHRRYRSDVTYMEHTNQRYGRPRNNYRDVDANSHGNNQYGP